ncbi:transcription antitermination protein NusB [Candidatus Hakubella thermalkaliphila]|uniref:Transcription antitermination protein NusB n=1 Tax=Candidatus Hakubella thermalkaliphila TaxID=2754717 RepID=A0A6V8QD77_9ACTN|nr:transcription antitermination factor NusB [Candidatus Hakubella thermalkaliphila]MBT9167577.1 N utilization substance protein B [Bacillota bacterium]GFP32423.1 transcription antitermination protein NusB [Candidatus Hakubella thermalkaliphila]GFP40751.1 transcription antitermination protein NusB [Candidatus Hakubella thermalkaliphila]GFP43107.1 transcription antitermination protein NusB [Candidatus Hakubella thermalkaliphila]
MSRRLARELAFKALFQEDLGKNGLEPALTELLTESGLSGDHAFFTRQLAEGALLHLEEIDNQLAKYLVNWEFGRLAAVDRSVLRLATYELLYCADIPTAVSINEALELSKLFNSDESAKFLNGVLDKLARDQEGGKEES